jgi:ABC-type sulfate transport system permease subunit
MSDRTQIAIGRNTISVPRITKRAVEVAVATGLTALASFMILELNTVLTGRTGFSQGLDLWLSFIRRSDILGTMILTAIVTVAYINWQRDGGGKR